jgi:hypothetical protein
LPYAVLAVAYERASRFPEATAISERANAEKLDGQPTHRTLYQIAQFEGDEAAMQREVGWFADIHDKSLSSLGHPFGVVARARDSIREGLWRAHYLGKIWPQCGSAVKAVSSLEPFLPDVKHGSGVGDCVDGGGAVLEKGQRPDPAGEIV